MKLSIASTNLLIALTLSAPALHAQTSAVTTPLPAGGLAPATITATGAITNSVVKVFATSRLPDTFKPWAKQSPQESTGSGVVIDGKRILTNAHVVSYASLVQVQANGSGEKFNARVVAIAPGIDLAVLQLEDESFFARHPPMARANTLPEVKDGVGLRISDWRHLNVDHQRHRLPDRVRRL